MPVGPEELRAVLGALRWHGPLDRRGLAYAAGLPLGTATAAAAELAEWGLVEQAGYGHSTGGRRPARWALAASSRFMLGLLLGVSRMSLVVVNLGGAAVGRKTVPMPDPPSPRNVAEAAAAGARRLWHELDIPPSRRVALGLALPGVYAEGKGVLFLPNLPGWNGSDPVLVFRDLLRLPVILENDANAAAYAEWHLGSARGLRSFLYCYMADGGTGGAVVMDGQLVRGPVGAAGEFGHLPTGGPVRCNCGLTGCLETEASVLALNRLRAEGVPEAEALESMGRVLGRTLSGLVNVLAPEAVVLGGHLPERYPGFWSTVAETGRTFTLPFLQSHLRYLPAALGAEAPAVGAALLAADRVPLSDLKGGGSG